MKTKFLLIILPIFLLTVISALFVKIPDAYAATCTATYNLNPSSPINANTDINVTIPAISSSNKQCLVLFKDNNDNSSDGGSCGFVGANQVLTCTVKSGVVAGLHTLQLKYGQDSYYQNAIPRPNCGSAVDCNSTTFQTNALPTATPAPLPAPSNLSKVCNANGTAVVLNWSSVSGASSYTVRINQEPFTDWMGPGDEAPTVTTNSYTRATTPGTQYDWSVQAQPASDPFASRTPGGTFSCNPAPTVTPTFTPTPTPTTKTAWYRVSTAQFDRNDTTIAWKPYTADPMPESLTFDNAVQGQDLTVFVQFKDDTGTLTSSVTPKSIKYAGPDPDVSNAVCSYSPSGDGTQITINGANFGNQGRNGKVMFNGKEAQIISWSNNVVTSVNTSASTPIPTTVSVSPKRVFATSTTYNGNLGGLSGADAKCQDRANSAGLGGTWKAWLSDSNTSAASRLDHSSQPYTLLNGAVIASNWTDLVDSSSGSKLKGAITVDEKSHWIIDALPNTWTGTGPDGLSGNRPNCNNWTDATVGISGAAGSSSEVDRVKWTYSAGSFDCASQARLYCFEQGSAVLGVNSTASRVVAKIKEKLAGDAVIPWQLFTDDNRPAPATASACTIDLTSVSFAAKAGCRPPGNFANTDVRTQITEKADKAKPIYNEKISLNTDGQPSWTPPALEVGKTYLLLVKAPKALGYKKEFTVSAGTNVLEDFNLLVGDIYGQGGQPDNVINAFDKAQLSREWNIITDTARPGDLNGDSRVNSVDYACMRQNIGKTGDQ